MNCGSDQQDGAKFCGVCGAAFPAEPGGYAPSAAPAAAAETKKEFMNLPENAALKKQLVTSAVFCYVCAAINLAIVLLTDSGYYPLIDVVLLVGLGLGIHLARSRVCAVILCAYGVINAVLGIAQDGKISGYLILLAGVYAVISTFRLDKQWKAYRGEA